MQLLCGITWCTFTSLHTLSDHAGIVHDIICLLGGCVMTSEITLLQGYSAHAYHHESYYCHLHQLLHFCTREYIVYLLEVYQGSCMVLPPGLMTAILCASGVTVLQWLVGFYTLVSDGVCVRLPAPGRFDGSTCGVRSAV